MYDFDDLKNERRYDGKPTERALAANWIGDEGNAWDNEETGEGGIFQSS